MNSKRPILLVDVDGVINCFGSIWTPAYDAEHFTIRGPVRVRHHVADAFRQLAEVYDMVWCTAWMERAHAAFGEWLGLGEPWPVIEFTNWTGHIDQSRSWKFGWVERWLAEQTEGRAVAWIDDDLSPVDQDWATGRTTAGMPTLLVKTTPSQGIHLEHVTDLLHFARTTGATT